MDAFARSGASLRTSMSSSDVSYSSSGGTAPTRETSPDSLAVAVAAATAAGSPLATGDLLLSSMDRSLRQSAADRLPFQNQMRDGLTSQLSQQPRSNPFSASWRPDVSVTTGVTTSTSQSSPTPNPAITPATTSTNTTITTNSGAAAAVAAAPAASPSSSLFLPSPSSSSNFDLPLRPHLAYQPTSSFGSMTALTSLGGHEPSPYSPYRLTAGGGSGSSSLAPDNAMVSPSPTTTTTTTRAGSSNTHDMTPIPDSSLLIDFNTSYAYCYNRGNGQYTRLIPADMLPPLKDVPPLQHGCAGMIPLTEPPAFAPNGRSSNRQPVEVRPIQAMPGSPSSQEHIQHVIDDIVAASPTHSPTTPSNAPAAGPTTATTATGGGGGGGGSSSSSHHHHHHHHHSGGGAGAGAATTGPKKTKVYCDKWVHEGVCAFTQQGCKYKHEMPHDRATQLALGLFHGLPAWYKKHQGELARPRITTATAASLSPLDMSPDEIREFAVLQQQQQQQRSGGRFGTARSPGDAARFAGAWRRSLEGVEGTTTTAATASSPTGRVAAQHGRLMTAGQQQQQQQQPQTPQAGGGNGFRGVTTSFVLGGPTALFSRGHGNFGPIQPPSRRAAVATAISRPASHNIVTQNSFSTLAELDDVVGSPGLDCGDDDKDDDAGEGAKLI